MRSSTLVGWLVLGVACGGEVGRDAGALDAELDDAGVACTTDAMCDDGRFCNGVERCDGICRPALDPTPCDAATETCDETLALCARLDCDEPDADGDGVDDARCGGEDCDDGDADRYPGNAEVCDAAGHDEDCAVSTLGDRDDDGDGHVSAACCNDDGETLRCGPDCDDENGGVGPSLPEVCNGRDDDCSGVIDEGLRLPLYVDGDGDGFGDRSKPAVMLCPGTPGYASAGTDCDDAEVAVFPGATETCNGVDDDCSGVPDDGAIFATCGGPSVECEDDPSERPSLIIETETRMLSGRHVLDEFIVRRGGTVIVPAYDGVDRVNSGNLEIIARRIVIDATSRIVARGAGYFTALCSDGGGPPEHQAAGGCSVMDSGGGGAHFGDGGRGTADCHFGDRLVCELPFEAEEDCNGAIAVGGACDSNVTCRDRDGLPSVAGLAFPHAIYDVEFGGAGGDKGCRDANGSEGVLVAGRGGGRILLAAPCGDGSIDVRGTIDAGGTRGCGSANDSAGGGAGGTVVLVADFVSLASTATLIAEGGLGGTTLAPTFGPNASECPVGAQTTGTCDDAGGGGGGGLVHIASRRRDIDRDARTSAAGAPPVVCVTPMGAPIPGYFGEGGMDGVVRRDVVYRGEIAGDGYDNDFDGAIDEL
jgi:hypothetical protein